MYPEGYRPNLAEKGGGGRPGPPPCSNEEPDGKLIQRLSHLNTTELSRLGFKITHFKTSSKPVPKWSSSGTLLGRKSGPPTGGNLLKRYLLVSLLLPLLFRRGGDVTSLVAKTVTSEGHHCFGSGCLISGGGSLFGGRGYFILETF